MVVYEVAHEVFALSVEVTDCVADPTVSKITLCLLRILRGDVNAEVDFDTTFSVTTCLTMRNSERSGVVTVASSGFKVQGRM